MSCISLNCRGIGNPEAVRELHGFVKQFDPALLFVTEIKIEGKRVKILASTFGFGGGFAVDSDGLSGGIRIFWSSVVEVDLKGYNMHHIDVFVTCKDGYVPPWRFTGIMVNQGGRIDIKLGR